MSTLPTDYASLDVVASVILGEQARARAARTYWQRQQYTVPPADPCPRAPTGAHYWFLETSEVATWSRCRYCKERRWHGGSAEPNYNNRRREAP